jgi:hypothetical protein
VTAITEALSDVFGYGVFASRPAAGIRGRVYYGTDTTTLYRDNSTSWDTLSFTGGAALTVEEVDGSPTDAAITKIVFPNGTLAIVGHVATYTPSGGGSALTVQEVDGSPIDTAITSIIFPNDTVSIASHVATVRAVPTGDVGCKVYKASAQTISNNSTTDCTFDSESWDTDGFAASGTNSGRPTIPAGFSGRYLVIAKWEWDANTSGVRLQYLTINGAQVEADFMTASQGDRTMGTIAAIVNLSAGDIISMSCYQNSGGNRTMTATIALHKLGSGKVGGAIGCKVYNSTTQAITNNSETVLTFDTEDFDTDGFHSTSSNTSRFTVPAGLSGKYEVIARAYFPFTASNFKYLGIWKNGNTTAIYRVAGPTATSPDTVALSTVLDLVAGDYIEITWTHDNGSTQNTGHASARRVQNEVSFMRLDSGSASYTGPNWGSGTAFPSGPATNDRFTRTDRGLDYFWDGSRWLTTTLYRDMAVMQDSLQPWTTSPSAIGRNTIWSGDYDLWLVDLHATMFGSGNTGSAFWTLTMAKGNTANTFTDIASVNNASAADSTWVKKKASINALLGSSDSSMRFTLTKTNSPNAVYVSAAYTYRLVG